MIRSLTARSLLLLAALGVSACSSSSSGGDDSAALDLRAIDFSLEHIVQRRIHADMWFQTVLAAIDNPTRMLSETPDPTDDCITVESVDGELETGFTWVLKATDCEDLTGVTRLINGEITFVGNPFADDRYTGTYSGTLTVQWSEDPDGGRAAEAAKLNGEAATVTISGSWEIEISREGFVSGTASYLTGSVTHVDEI